MNELFPNESRLPKGVPEQVRCLSMWQPWATALCTPHPLYPNRGLKEYETRGRSTEVRERILIHATKKWDAELQKILDENYACRKNAAYLQNLPKGFIIGSVVIDSVITSEKFEQEGPDISETPADEWMFGNWEPGRFGWKCKDPVLFDTPIPFQGMQTILYRVPINLVAEKYHHLF